MSMERSEEYPRRRVGRPGLAKGKYLPLKGGGVRGAGSGKNFERKNIGWPGSDF